MRLIFYSSRQTNVFMVIYRLFQFFIIDSYCYRFISYHFDLSDINIRSTRLIILQNDTEQVCPYPG